MNAGLTIDEAKEGMAEWVRDAREFLKKADASFAAGEDVYSRDRVEAVRVAAEAIQLAIESEDGDVFTFGWACWQHRLIQQDGHNQAIVAGIDVAIQIAGILEAQLQRQIESN